MLLGGSGRYPSRLMFWQGVARHHFQLNVFAKRLLEGPPAGNGGQFGLPWAGHGARRYCQVNRHLADCVDAKTKIQLPTTPFSFRNYQSCRLALSSLLPQFPCSRRVTGGTRHHRHLRNRSPMVPEAGTGVRAGIEEATRSTR